MDAFVLPGSFALLMIIGKPVAYGLGMAALVGALWIDLPLDGVMIQVGFAASFGYIMTLMQNPSKNTAVFTSVSDNRYVILTLINIMLLALGTLMDMAPLILILTSVLLPVVKLLGIGLITPPVGVVQKGQ